MRRSCGVSSQGSVDSCLRSKFSAALPGGESPIWQSALIPHSLSATHPTRPDRPDTDKIASWLYQITPNYLSLAVSYAFSAYASHC